MMANGNGKRRRSMVVGLMVLLVFGGVFAFAINAEGGLPGSSGQQVKAAFSDVGALSPGDEVRIGNVRAGKVREIERVDGRPVVTMELDQEWPVYRDTSAVVGARSGLGQKYIDLDLGTPESGRLGSDEVVPAKQTGDAKDVTDLVDAFDAPTRKALGSTLRELGGGALGHSRDLSEATSSLPEMLPDMAQVSRALSRDSGASLTKLMKSANSLAKSFEGRQQHLGELAENLNGTLRALHVDNGVALADTLTTAPEALVDTRTALRSLRKPLADTEQAISEVRPGASSLGAAIPDIRGVLREGRAPLERVPGIAEQAEPAVSALTKTVHDARPLAPEARRALSTAQRPLNDIAPFAPEISAFFTNFADVLKYGDQAGHYARIYPPVNTDTATGVLPLKDPTVSREVYTEPGEAPQQSETGLVGKRGDEK